MTHTNDFCGKKSDKVTTFSGPKKEEEIAIFLGMTHTNDFCEKKK
jgi:hypothetical protein